MVIANPNLATNADTIIKALSSYAPRQINRDYYQSYTVDARMIRKYNLFGHESALSGGLKYSNISTDRRQNGTGTTATDFDLTQPGDYGINLLFRTVNYGAFIENLFRITNRLSVTPGLRYDHINSTLNGTEHDVYNDFRPVSHSTSRNILVSGVGAQYRIAESIDIYGNYSQAYRPILYSNLIIGSSTAVIDPNLKDGSGHNLDIGIRGKIKNILNFDVSGFELSYRNRIGSITLTDGTGNPYTFTTNAGDALTKGVEAYLEIHLLNLINEHTNSDLSIFSSYADNDDEPRGRDARAARDRPTRRVRSPLIAHLTRSRPTWQTSRSAAHRSSSQRRAGRRTSPASSRRRRAARARCADAVEGARRSRLAPLDGADARGHPGRARSRSGGRAPSTRRCSRRRSSRCPTKPSPAPRGLSRRADAGRARARTSLTRGAAEAVGARPRPCSTGLLVADIAGGRLPRACGCALKYVSRRLRSETWV